ncbi:MAG TPA: Hsp70 family protein, partial [Pirellulales bacterium]|nr:Hsp70 family protein [Pirellulales bacterium]
MPTEDTDIPSRYVIGIDLGTTNSAVAFVDTTAERWQVETFPVPQLVAAGVVEARETLPSFHYQRAEGEFAAGVFRLPWSGGDPNYAVGVLARDQGANAPGRLIASAKSWLCHSGVDRLADLLPWHGAPDVDRISPVEVSGRYLAHIRAAWNHRFHDEPLENQEVVLTLPASFDEVARELTVKAAAAAGLPRVVVIEEPQAAIYQWINAHRENWEQLVRPGQKILICDIGGGTSDFSLIHVDRDSQGKTQFHRVAVGEHLILGGDNLDLALAHHVERKLVGDGKLEPRQWSVLVQRARQVKEALLAADPPERLTLSLPGSSSRLIGGAVQVELTRDEVQRLLIDGFFPHVRLDEKPLAHRSGFQEFGLPYAADAAITRYLAAFLTAHRHTTHHSPLTEPGADAARLARAEAHDLARPDVVLFNGGVFDAPLLRDRMIEVIRSWFAGGGDWRPEVLENERRDLAVARGAAYYGMVRRGLGVRIAAGLARSYFIGATTAEGAAFAVCILPAGVEEGQAVELADREFDLLIREPVEFPLFVSSTRLVARPGDVMPVDPEQMTPLPAIRTVLQSGKRTATSESVAVHLHAKLTEIGTLELWFSEAARDRPQPKNWKLQFDVRAATRTDLTAQETLGERGGIVDQAILDACRSLIRQTFCAPSAVKPESLVKRLIDATEISRTAWPPSLLRGIWEALMEVETGRKQSPQHETRWLSLLGFALRPGYGMAVDDWRVVQTRRLLSSLVFNNPASRAEWWILWRRIAGGLPAGQQRALAQPPLADIRNGHRALAKGRGLESRTGSHEAAELWRMIGSLELLATSDKIELGNMLLDTAPREKVSTVASAAIWALGRIGARVPLYGPLNTVVPSDVAGTWIERIMKMPAEPQAAPLAL